MASSASGPHPWQGIPTYKEVVRSSITGGGWETGPRGVIKILVFLADISFSERIAHGRGLRNKKFLNKAGIGGKR